MWCDDLPAESTWAALWRGYILCARCRGIRTVAESCPACEAPPPSLAPRVIRTEDGQEFEVATAFMGAEGRYEDWVFLILLEREWKRSTTDDALLTRISEQHRPSDRAAFVLLFWTYFETRFERLLRQGMAAIPEPIVADLLQRYSSIGARLDRLYRVLFGTTYWADLEDLGYGQVAALLRDVQERRNRFVHGHPEAIDDTIVQRLGEGLKREHEAWIAAFNRRAALSLSTDS